MRDLLQAPGRWLLRLQLAVVAVVMTLLAWAAGVAVTAHVAEREAIELHDRELSHVAGLLLGLASQELDEMGPDATLGDRIANTQADTRQALGNDYRYQIWAADGRLLLSNFGTPHAAAMAQLGRMGYSDLQMDGESWRIYTMHDKPAGKEIQVAERNALRHWAVTRLDLPLALLIVISAFIVLGPTLWLLNRMLRPLGDLAGKLGARSSINLEPVALAHTPAELEPVVAAVNRLFQRVADAMDRERGFTALAAHEMRTPLATLRVLAQAMASCDDETQRRALVEDLVASVDRCTHLQEQLLTIARLDALDASQMNAETELAETVVDVQSELLPEARRREVALAVRVDGTTVRAHRFGLRTLMRNLAINAIRYTPAGGRVELSIATRGSDAVIEVNDSGPGIPLAERARVFERFVRLPGTHSSGVGLGLSIVRTVADAHGARVELGDSPLGGLRVVVTLVARAVAGWTDLAPESIAPADEQVLVDSD